MSEQDRPLAEVPDEEYERHRSAQVLIQEAIGEVVAGSQGRDRDAIVASLTSALAARGIGQQPPRWLEAVADAAQEGKTYIEDPALGRRILQEQERQDQGERD